MLDTSFVYFSFVAGLVAFFAPCSFAILPGYVTYYISKRQSAVKRHNISRNLFQGIVFGLIASTGFFTVFGAAGIAVIYIGQFVKRFIPWIAVITGFMLIFMGILMFFGRDILLFHIPEIKLARKNEKIGIYLFGIAYAIGSLDCVFPLFISIVVQAIASNSFLNGSYVIMAYVLGMSVVMTSITALIFAAKHLVLKKLEAMLPYFRKLSASVIVIAGIYMIYYQYLLFR